MTSFTNEELRSTAVWSFADKTSAETLSGNEHPFDTPARAISALQQAQTYAWFDYQLEGDSALAFLRKVEDCFKKLLRTAKTQAQRIVKLVQENNELRQKLTDSEEANQLIVQREARKEQELKNVHRDEVAELTARLAAANEAKGQLEERLRIEDPVALRQELEDTKNLLIGEQLKDKSTEPERAWKYELANQELHAAQNTIAQLDKERRELRLEISKLLEERCEDPSKHEFVFRPVDPASRGSAGGYQ